MLALRGGETVVIQIKSPLINELLAKARQEYIVDVLTARFGKVPRDIRIRLSAVIKEKELKALHRFAAQCPTLEAFRERLPS
jgi:hypothetical protein